MRFGGLSADCLMRGNLLMPLIEDDRTSAQPSTSNGDEIAIITEPPRTAGIRAIEEGAAPLRTRGGPRGILLGGIIVGFMTTLGQIPTYGASMCSTDTFGSYDAAARLESEYRAQRARRARLLKKRYERRLTPGERRELESLQAAEGRRLSAELGPSIDYLRDILRT